MCVNGNIFKFSCLIRCVYFLVSPLFSTFLCRVFVVFFYVIFRTLSSFSCNTFHPSSSDTDAALSRTSASNAHGVPFFYCLRKKRVKGISNVGKQFGHV